ncbi:MAG: RNA 2',3'-cyclic phosphodiesterase [Chitinophagaceae bacterium]|nr:RNA 2',3'-cyclic phosphodiesterase [Chitinophagaceae bacterium]
MRRIFFAISIPPETRQSLWQLFSHQHYFGIRWIDQEQLHITVHFLGEVENETIAQIALQLPVICNSIPAFDLQIENFRTVSKNQKPTMIWAQLEDHLSFSALCLSLRSSFPTGETRMPQPHITLARIRQLHQLPFDLPKAKPFLIPVNSVELWESHLHADGSKYQVLGQWKLKK